MSSGWNVTRQGNSGQGGSANNSNVRESVTTPGNINHTNENIGYQIQGAQGASSNVLSVHTTSQTSSILSSNCIKMAKSICTNVIKFDVRDSSFGSHEFLNIIYSCENNNNNNKTFSFEIEKNSLLSKQLSLRRHNGRKVIVIVYQIY